MSLSLKIPKNIRKFRELKNLTREEVASLLEMSPSGYAKIEQGMVDISIRKLEQISKVLGVDVEQIMHFNSLQFFGKGKQASNSNQLDTQSSTFTNQNTDYLVKLVESLERENKLLRKLIDKD